MKKKKFTILKIILIVIISILIGFMIYSWNSKMVGKSIPMPLGFGLAEVMSDSMYPTINKGDVIVVVPQDEYNVDDIVAFEDASVGGIVTHKIVDVNEDGTFVTKGDNPENSVDPAPLREQYILGKVVTWFSGLGAVVSVLQSPIIIMLMILIIAFLLFFATKKEKETDNAQMDKIKKEIAAIKGEDVDMSIDDIQAQIDALKQQAEENKKKK